VSLVPVFKPLLEEEERSAAEKVLLDGWLGMGASVHEFESALHEFLELEHRQVVAVSTGHAALHLALLWLGIGSGDEVITASFNSVADFQAILAVGARPVFCDIRDDTLCIDPDRVAELVGPRTRAMIVMDYALHLCDHAALGQIAQQLELHVIHDAAHSFGSRLDGTPMGHQAGLTTFSFDAIKTITSIDGGAIVIPDDSELERFHAMRLIGMSQSASVMYRNQRAATFDVVEQGFRYHLANLHAAIGVEQLGKVERITAGRRRAVGTYESSFSELGWLRTPGPLRADIVPFLYYVRVPPESKDSFRRHLYERQIDTGVHWIPGHWFSLLKDMRKGPLSVTDRVGHEIVTLPLHSDMDEATVGRVVGAVCSFRPS
jgi:dTDP-4-amino-4,6-dideoxygalactose transaminase